jgi:hypothetical protein
MNQQAVAFVAKKDFCSLPSLNSKLVSLLFCLKVLGSLGIFDPRRSAKLSALPAHFYQLLTKTCTRVFSALEQKNAQQHTPCAKGSLHNKRRPGDPRVRSPLEHQGEAVRERF